MAEIENEGDPKDFLSKLEYKYYMKSRDSLLIILSKTGYNVLTEGKQISSFNALKYLNISEFKLLNTSITSLDELSRLSLKSGTSGIFVG